MVFQLFLMGKIDMIYEKNRVTSSVKERIKLLCKGTTVYMCVCVYIISRSITPQHI